MFLQLLLEEQIFCFPDGSANSVRCDMIIIMMMMATTTTASTVTTTTTAAAATRGHQQKGQLASFLPEWENVANVSTFPNAICFGSDELKGIQPASQPVVRPLFKSSAFCVLGCERKSNIERKTEMEREKERERERVVESFPKARGCVLSKKVRPK